MKNLSTRWQKLIVWLTGYLSIIAFVIAGGYIHQKTESEDVKRSAKISLFAVAVFTAFEILFSIISYCYNLADTYNSWVSYARYVLAIIKAVAFVSLFIVDMVVGFGKPLTSEPVVENAETETSDSESEIIDINN